MSTEVNMALWQGRTDPEPNSKRWHQRIQPLTEKATPGCALLGFASDAGVARNQGRIGAAKGPVAIRRALAPKPGTATALPMMPVTWRARATPWNGPSSSLVSALRHCSTTATFR